MPLIFAVGLRALRKPLNAVARVSRETATSLSDADCSDALRLVPELAPHVEQITTLVALLDRWRKVTNLVSDASFAGLWTRHIADSAQLLAAASAARSSAATSITRWLDLGTGAGFPGLVIAILLSKTPGAIVHCVEADKRKCAFLREAARATGAPATIHPHRIETLTAADIPNITIVTARALSPLPRLLQEAAPWLDAGALGIFPRGASERQTPLDAAVAGTYDITSTPSRTDPRGTILLVNALKDNV